MERRIPLYVSKKHPAIWIMGILMLASIVARIAVFSQVPNIALWRQIVLPSAAICWYVWTIICLGEKRLYKSAAPIWLLGICTGWQLFHVHTPFIFVMECICILFFCGCYTAIIDGRHKPWLLLPLYLTLLGIIAYTHWQLLDTVKPMQASWYVLPDYLLVAGLLVMLFALKVHTDGKYYPARGDRSDGRLIRSTHPIDQIGPYIMPERIGSSNLFSESVEITELERYVRRKRREGLTGFGMSHAIIAAYVRTVAKYPALNRFVAGQRVYSRGEDIALSMTVKKELSASSPDTVIKARLNPHDTAADVYRKFDAQVEEAKNTPLESNVDNTANILTMMPRVVLKFVVWLIRVADYFGLVPAFLLEISPFHGSAYFTSMGSLGIKPVYHHLYNFGTIPVFCSFGRKRRAEEICDGQIVERKYVDLKFSLDERICDGYYYASAIKHFIRILSRPQLLDEAPETVEQDVP